MAKVLETEVEEVEEGQEPEGDGNDLNVVKGKKGFQARKSEPNVAGTAPIAAAPVQYVNMDDLTRLAQIHASVDLAQMPASFSATNATELPVIDRERTRKVKLPFGREMDVPVDIGWENRKKYKYAWLDAATQATPEFNGYTVVTKGCPAAYGDGGKHIPESYFRGLNFIRVNTVALCYAKLSYAESHKDVGQKRAIASIKHYEKGRISDKVETADGTLAGCVETLHNDPLGLENLHEND